jgi:hypothetical protein
MINFPFFDLEKILQMADKNSQILKGAHFGFQQKMAVNFGKTI